jgi:3-phytase
MLLILRWPACIVSALALVACATGDPAVRTNSRALTVAPVTVAEAWISAEAIADTPDSIAVTVDADGRRIAWVTAKSGHRLVGHDVDTGDVVRTLGSEGTAPGQFLRPNGVAAAGGLLWTVETRGARAQIIDPADGRALAVFGAGEIALPYGIAVETLSDGHYLAYITDSDQANGASAPPAAALARRVHVYAVRITDDLAPDIQPRATFGATEGPGALHMVESIAVDAVHDQVLVAEEDARAGQVLKVYRRDGRWTGTNIGIDRYAYQPEGVALYACPDGSGWWVASDQHEVGQRFLVFARGSLDYAGAFRARHVRMTDGVAIVSVPTARFPHGVILVQHDDRAIAAIDWADVAQALGLPQGCAGD